MSWSVVTYSYVGSEHVGILRADGTVAALDGWPTALALFDDWAAALPVLQALDAEALPTAAYGRLLAPIRYPRKVICAGVNYRKHVAEMGAELPGAGWAPWFFLKAPTTTVIGPYDPIPLHGDPATTRYDWEAELAVVIGAGGRDIPAATALDHVAGYAVANDVTARGLHRRSDTPAEAFDYDWFAAKSSDGTLPLGPGVTPAFLVPDPQDLRIRLWVNGEPRQEESTADMICPIADLVSAASAHVTLEPGDVICTGTPSGVGVARGLHLVGGDVVRVAVDGLPGALENPVEEH